MPETEVMVINCQKYLLKLPAAIEIFICCGNFVYVPKGAGYMLGVRSLEAVCQLLKSESHKGMI